MCMFAGPVEKVSGTQIYVARKENKQFTAYQMEVSLSANPVQKTLDPWAATRNEVVTNAMILPVPLDVIGEITLVDLSKVPTFFDDLNTPFVERLRGRGLSKGMYLGLDEDHLEVHDVGDYKVSIARTIKDINRADPSVFKLGSDTASTLTKHYADGFAFVIASLKKSGKISPLGYISDIPAANLEKEYPLFIPTRHEHGDEEGLPKWDHFIFVGGKGRFEARPEGRRPVGIIGGTLSRSVGDNLVEATQGFVEPGPISRMRAEGKLANMDLAAGT